ncbi:MAG: FAD-binding oxidoreductase [Sandaracinaceae bacterium]
MSSPPRAALDRALAELARAIGDSAIDTDEATRHALARDESDAEPTMPDAVVHVRSTEQLARAMAVAHRHAIPVTPRGGGTGRAGGAVPRAGGWLLALDGWRDIDEVHRNDAVVVTRPGVVLGDLHSAVEAEGLFYPPDPNSWASCTIGGNLATDAGGPRAFKYGVTSHYALGLEVVLADGTRLEVGRRTKKGVTGYDLTRLIVGSEGTLAVITRATLHLVPQPEAVRTLVCFVDDEDEVAQVVTACLEQRVVPRCVELLDRHALEVAMEEGAVAPPPGTRAMLLVELDGDESALDGQVERLGSAWLELGALDVLVAKHDADRERLWSVRRELSRLFRRRAAHKLSEDVVVPRSQIGALLAAARAIAERTQIRMPTYGHAGDGNLHVNFLWDHADERPRVDQAIDALLRATLALGGTLTGEHGIGAVKRDHLPLEQSEALIELQRGIKDRLDPRGILNPHKIFPDRTGHGPC